MTQMITQAEIEAAKAVLRAVREANNPVNNARNIHTFRSVSPTLRQPTFDR